MLKNITMAVALACVGTFPAEAATRITFLQGGFSNSTGLSGGIASGSFLLSGDPDQTFSYDKTSLVSYSLNFTIGSYSNTFSDVSQVTAFAFIPAADFYLLGLVNSQSRTGFVAEAFGSENFYRDPGFFVASNQAAILTTEFVPDGVAPVPEPATWAMMLIGFGMIAGATRYRRRSTATTYA